MWRMNTAEVEWTRGCYHITAFEAEVRVICGRLPRSAAVSGTLPFVSGIL